MRRLAIALSVATLLLLGCSSQDDSEDSTTGDTTAEQPSGDRRTDTEEDTDTDAEPDQDTGATTSDPSNEVAGSDLDAPRPGQEVLEDRWLQDGRVSIGPGAPQEQEVNLAMCDYLFGTADEVAERAGVDGEVVLDEESGFSYNGSAPSRMGCVYLAEGTEAFMVGLQDRELEVEDEHAELVVALTELPSGWYGFVVSNPDWDGRLALDEAAALDWLQDADTRWGGAGI